MDYIQALFSFFNAPLFATFIMAMFWKRATPWGASGGWPRARSLRSPSTSSTPAARWIWARRWRPTSGGRAAFVVDVVVTVAVSLATQPKPDHELRGLVWGLTETEDRSAEEDPAERVWWRRPGVLGGIALALTALLYLVFVF